MGFPDERFLHYETDTAPGSSGSPVFNDQWEVVGLHHSGVPKRDSAGRILARDGSVWRSESGEHQIDWIANEGVRVAAILADLRSRPLNSGQREVRRQLLDGEPPHEDWRPNPQGLQPAAAGAVLAVPGAVQTGGAGPVVTPDGRAVWTIPLLISVELGGGAGLPPAEPGPPPPAPGGRDRRGEGPDAGGPSPGDDDLGRALDDLDRGESRPYYDADADRAERQQYYAALPEGLSPADKFDRLHELLEATHARTPPYKPRLHVYPWVDLQPNRMLRSIYSGQEFDPVELIQADFEIEQERLSRLSEFATREADVSPEALRAQEDLLEAALPFNCEHVVPQSWFNKREPMRGDLHHLFACESRCNSFRGNTPYFDFVDFGEAVRSECGKREGNRFEPEAGKGAAARATLYFLLRYPGLIDATSSEYTAERLDTLLAWHRQFGVTDYERHRNAAVFEKQGNRNPLIDFPAWGNDIDFKRGLG
ncbi:MAG: endonuclease [Planctomycetes bacterium]|nr:endonuclease [Planctomycetota bacterium]